MLYFYEVIKNRKRLMRPDDLLWYATGCYGVGIVAALPRMTQVRPLLNVSALAALGAGMILNGAALLSDALHLHRLPLTGVETALSFFAFCVTAAFFLIYLRFRRAWLGFLVLPFVFILTLASAVSSGPLPVSTPLRARWLLVHSAAMILAYTGLFLTFVAAVMYLMQAGELKSKHPKALYTYLPSLEACDKLYDRSLIFGLACMTAGLVTGFLWAHKAWTGSWEWDPKIVASLFTWFIYIALVSARFRGNGRGRRSAYVAILGFAAILITFLGVSLVSVKHGYFPTAKAVVSGK
jgi:ABC-type transport system involved in cytochrome c biogenesis permease subunit